MNRESVAAGVAGIFFGLLAGWILGSQSSRSVPAPTTVAAQAQSAQAQSSQAQSSQAQSSQAPSSQGPSQRGSPPQPGAPKAGPQSSAPAPLDQTRVDALIARANTNPRDAAVRTEIANLYFDAERYRDAITWYEASLAIDSKNPDVSTDLGVSYYYTNQPDRALAQFAHSLAVDPRHTKTMLNLGVVRAFGKQDLDGAAAAWRKVVELAPETAEGRAARQMIEALRQAHPEVAAGAKEGA